MLALIAESKTMHNCDQPVSSDIYAQHRPLYGNIADEIMGQLTKMSIAEISAELNISMRQAVKISEMAYEFPNKGLGLPAIKAYSGVVFKALDYSSLSSNDKEDALKRIGIISSIYGWLNSDDIIKTYRMDFNIPLAPDDKKFYDYWRKNVTIALVHKVQGSGMNVILNMLPNDAAKCVDWKLVKRFAKVYKIDFKELKEGGVFRTPNSSKLKTLRGELLRTIIKQHITSPTELLSLSTNNLSPLGTPDYPDHIAFEC